VGGRHAEAAPRAGRQAAGNDGERFGRQRWPHASQPAALRAAGEAAAGRDRRRRWRRLPQLCPRRPFFRRLPRSGAVRLHRRRRAVRDRGQPRLSRAPGAGRDGRRVVRIQRHRARHGRATRSRGGVRGREQWRLADRGPRPDVDLRPRRRNEAAVRRSRGDGARLRPACRARRAGRRLVRRDRSRLRPAPCAARRHRHAGGGLGRCEVRPPGFRICSRSRRGTKRSAPGGTRPRADLLSGTVAAWAP